MFLRNLVLFSSFAATTLTAYSEELLSLASKRAIERNYEQGPEWYTEFEYRDLQGDLAYEEGIIRRDPSALIEHEGLYYVYYTKGEGKTYGFGTGDPNRKVFPWDLTEIWYATSGDGITWVEHDRVVARGPEGSFDDRACFTPEILRWENKFYLVYQVVKAPYTNRVKNQIAMAVADSPKGPFVKLEEPILSPSDDGEWLGEEDNRFLAKVQGSFDSHKVHDPCIVPYRGKFYLYYKGERMGERQTFGGREIKWGVAISDSPTGPYEKSPYNPVTNSGHEVTVWPYRDGIAALIITDGPERNTIQWAQDGINFEIKSHIRSGPVAAGLNRTLNTNGGPLEPLGWGLTHAYKGNWQHITYFRSKPLVVK